MHFSSDLNFTFHSGITFVRSTITCDLPFAGDLRLGHIEEERFSSYLVNVKDKVIVSLCLSL